VYVITGATGNIGSQVVDKLLARGERPRVFVRDAVKAHGRWGDRVDVAVGDLGDAQSVRRAMSGATAALVLTSGPEIPELDAIAASACAAAGVKLVKLSSIDARAQNVGTGVWHAAGEGAVRDSGARYVFVQPSGFMSNALYWARAIVSQGCLRSSTGDGAIPFIHPDDIAEVATLALVSAKYDGQALDITGPEALTYAQMVAIIGTTIARPLRYEAISDAEARSQQQLWGAQPAMVEARLSIFKAIRDGLMAEVTQTLPRLLGRPGHSFGDWAAENRAAFVS
jgi:uncharacterized protein YbjT (DUF2867 family)